MKTADVAPKDVLSTLESALEILRDPKRWVKDTLAQDAAGKDVPPLSKAAVRFCASAAIQHVLKARESSPIFKAAITELNVTVGKLYPSFHAVEAMNDGSKGHKQVVRVYEETIKRVRLDAPAEKPKKAKKVKKAKAKTKPA